LYVRIKLLLSITHIVQVVAVKNCGSIMLLTRRKIE